MVSITGDKAVTVGTDNSFKYRGYYNDEESWQENHFRWFLELQ